MPSDRTLIEREMADVDLDPFSIDEFHQRRHRQARNRRIRASALGVVVMAVVIGGALSSDVFDPEQNTITSDVPGPNLTPRSSRSELRSAGIGAVATRVSRLAMRSTVVRPRVMQVTCEGKTG